MRLESKGAVLFEGEQTISADQQRNLRAAIGSDTAAITSLLVPWFGPSVGGEDTVARADGLALDLSRALLAGITYQWERAFAPGETVHIRVSVADCYVKGANTFGIVAAEVVDADGKPIQTQTATFIERGGA